MNVLIYVMDSLRQDHLPFYGYGRNTSPNLAEFARDCVVFENARSQATWTRPSAASFLTGLYPLAHGVTTMYESLGENIPYLPEQFSLNGYKTFAVSTLTQISSYFGFHRGFSEFHELFKDSEVINKRTAPQNEKILSPVPQHDIFPTSEDINSRFLPWIDKNFKENFLAFLWSIDTHIPYLEGNNGIFSDPEQKSKFDGSMKAVKSCGSEDDFRQMLNFYDNQIHFNDKNFGNIIEKLKKLGIYDKTMIIVLSDHGEIYNEHIRFEESSFVRLIVDSGLSKTRLGGKFGYVGHLFVMPYKEVLNVPLLIKFPQNSHAGKVVKAPVQLVDLFPTIMDIARINKSSSLKIHGKSLLNIINNESDAIEYSFSHSQVTPWSNQYISVSDGKYKYVRVIPAEKKWANFKSHPLYFLLNILPKKTSLLFDETENEYNDLCDTFPDQARRLHAISETIINECNLLLNKHKHATPASNIDSEVMEKLKSLGYMD